MNRFLETPSWQSTATPSTTATGSMLASLRQTTHQLTQIQGAFPPQTYRPEPTYSTT